MPAPNDIRRGTADRKPATSDDDDVLEVSPERRAAVFHWSALGAVVAFGAIIRLHYLSLPMRYDESFSFTHYVAPSLRSALADYSTPNNHLFHTLLSHMSTQLFGNHAWAIRLPAFIAGVLIVPAAYAAVRRLYSREAGLVAAALVAGSSQLIEFSVNARGYTMVVLAFLVLIALATRLIEHPSVTGWLTFSWIASLGLWTIPVMVLPLGAVLGWMGVRMIADDPPGSRSLLLTRLLPFGALTAALAAALYAPAMAHSGLKALASNIHVTPLGSSVFSDRLVSSIGRTWQVWNRDVLSPLKFLILAAFVTALITHRGFGKQRIPLVPIAVAWITIFVFGRRVIPPDRVWTFLLVLYLGTAAAGIGWACSRARFPSLSSMAAVTLLAVMGLTVGGSNAIARSTDTGTLPDAEAMTLFLKSYLRGGDRLLVTKPGDAIIRYYFDAHRVPARFLVTSLKASDRVLFIVNLTRSETVDRYVRILRNAGAPGAQGEPPKVIARYPSAILYETNGTD